jgi:vacuolar-type H+-ATPase subunit I/STV1
MATNQMTTLINNIIDVNINNFIMNISKYYKIDQKELQDLWLQTIQHFQAEATKTEETKTEATKTEETKTEATKTETTKTEETKTEATKTEETKTEATKTEETKTEATKTKEKHECNYKFTRGKNKGQICATKTKEEFCSKHRKVKKKTRKNNVPVYQNPVDKIKPQDTSENESKMEDISENESKMEDISENESKMEDISENESNIEDISENESNIEDNDINTNNLTYDEVEDIINEVLNN